MRKQGADYYVVCSGYTLGYRVVVEVKLREDINQTYVVKGAVITQFGPIPLKLIMSTQRLPQSMYLEAVKVLEAHKAQEKEG